MGGLEHSLAAVAVEVSDDATTESDHSALGLYISVSFETEGQGYLQLKRSLEQQIARELTPAEKGLLTRILKALSHASAPQAQRESTTASSHHSTFNSFDGTQWLQDSDAVEIGTPRERDRRSHKRHSTPFGLPKVMTSVVH